MPSPPIHRPHPGGPGFFRRSIRHVLKVVPCVWQGQVLFSFLAVSTALTFFQSGAASAQIQQAWSARYHGDTLVPAEDSAIKILVDAAGNCIVIGQGGNLDYQTIKYSPGGVRMWSAAYDGTDSTPEQPKDAALDGAGNVLVTGYSTNPNGIRDATTVKYSANGARLWVDRLSITPTMNAEGYGVITDTNGSAYVFGYAGTVNLLVKYDPLGNRLWTVLRTNSFRSDGVAFGYQFGALDSQGNVAVTSPAGDATQTAKYSSAGNELWTRIYTNYGGGELALDATDSVYVSGSALIRYAPDGTLMWAREGIPFDFLNVGVLKVGRSGSVYVGALVYNTDPNCPYCYHFRTSKYDTNGNLLWTNALLANPYDTTPARVWPLDLDDAENIFLTVAGNGVGGADFLTIKYSSNGIALLTNLYNGFGNGIDSSRAIAIDSAGNAFVTGTSRGLVGNDIATVKYSSSGSEAWVARYDSLTVFANHQAYFVAIDDWKNAIVAGNSTGAGGSSDYDYAVVKYAPNGARLWSAGYASPGNAADTVRGIAVDSNGSVFITGSTRTLKYSVNGNPQWSLPMSGVGVVVDSNGSVCVAGFSNTWSVIKLNSDGTTNWTRTTNPFGSPRAESTHLAVDALGNVYVSGTVVVRCDRYYCYSYAGIAKYSPTGDLQWVWLPPTYYIDGVSMMALSSDGDVYLARRGSRIDFFKISSQGQTIWNAMPPSVSTLAAIAPDSDGRLYALLGDRLTVMAFNTNGSLVWQSNYLAASFGASIVVDSGGVYLTGNAPNINGRTDVVTIKCEKNGKQLWMRLYNGPNHQDDWVRNMAIDADGGVYVVGYQGGQNGLVEMLTVKYAELNAIQVQADQTAQLQFFGTPGQIYRFQASTNLASWEDLGIAYPDTNNIARFLDTNAPFYSNRFYRMLIP